MQALCKWLDTHGVLSTLRHGFKCFGKTLRIAFFRPAHGLNPELEARYKANRLGLTRQLHFSPKNEKSLDVVLSVNGIPVVTLELKNPLSGQTAANAIHQYRHDRDPRELIFQFTKRTLVHFSVDTEEAHMTTRLAGTSTHFSLSTEAIRVVRATSRTRRVETTKPLICGKKCYRVTVCSICWHVFSI